jgi:HEAT repeat protein
MAEGLEPISSDNPGIIIGQLRQYSQKGKLSHLQEVLKFIKHPVEGVKVAATKSASNIIRENLITHYNELEKDVRSKLGILLQSLDPRIIDEISRDLYCESNERRVRAVQILGLLKKNPRIRDILVELVKDRDEKIRATAINLLGKVVGPNDQELILSLLNDTDKRVRANTIEAIESLGNKRLVPVLIRFRKDGNNRIRGNILKALHTLGHTEIENDLLEMIGTASDLMKASALWVISQAKIASQKLEDAAGFCFLSENEMVLRNARNALTAMNTPRSKGYLRYLELPREEINSAA